MGRAKPESRLGDLLEAATRVFIAEGYRRTQMADVAHAMGVAKGTVYLYVESKEALFDLVLRHALGQQTIAGSITLPFRTPKPGATLREIKSRLSLEAVPATLTAALERTKVSDAFSELEGVLRELFTLLNRNRTAIRLVDRCARDYPELAAVWYGKGRSREVEALTSYLRSPARRRHLRSLPDAAVAARIVLETITYWAVHRYWDPSPQAVDAKAAEDTAVQFILGALLKT